MAAGGRGNGAGASAVAANAPIGNGITDGMEPVQRDCWGIFNHPDAQAKESGVGMEEVRVPHNIMVFAWSYLFATTAQMCTCWALP